MDSSRHEKIIYDIDVQVTRKYLNNFFYESVAIRFIDLCPYFRLYLEDLFTLKAILL